MSRPPRLTPTIQAAIDWLVLLDSGTSQAADRLAFEAWLQGSAEHRQAWAEVSGALARPLEQLGAAQQRIPGSEQVATRVLRQSGVSLERRRLLRGGTALLLLAGLPSVLTLQRRMPLEGLFTDYCSGTAERRRIRLADGSLLTLNARTTLDVDYSATQRQVRLHQGELCAEVVDDPAVPFQVLCAEGRVRTAGGSFVLAQEAGRSWVSVARGTLEVLTRQGQRLQLGSGQSASFSAERPELVANPARRLDAWVQGRVDVQDESLGWVIDSLRPYRYGLLRVAPQAAALRVFGVFPLDDTERALQSLAQVLPIRVQHYGPLTLIDLA
ncbi:MAG: Protein FecR [Pseudomonas citronellolis]|nr:MAG: Protein FecR [Pseudomonas citronellolis]